MAIADELRSFLETRLQALDASIDLSENSRAQIRVIEPALRRFAEDPFSTDISLFIRDRMIQEYPDLAADGGGMLDDIFSKPLQMLLEPFKREIELVKVNQSVTNAALMSEDEADAHAANWFETRDQGGSAGGTVRLYFSTPTAARVTTDKRCYTNSGLGFFPVQSYFITAQQMLFNRQGNFYFLDIVVRAEDTGDEYNIAKGEIVGIDDVAGVVKASNLSDFIDGAPREDNETFLQRTEQSLTDRSLVVPRGVLTRVPKEFEAVRALQVIGAGDEGMNRDILTGTGEGFLHLAGKATLYGDWMWVSEVTYRDDGPNNAIIPQAGDTIRFHAGSPAPSTTNVVTVKIASVLSSSDGKYLFVLESAPFAAPATTSGSFALFKPGYLTISGVPGGMSSSITVPDNTVHIGGHTDILVRPTEDATLQGTLKSVTDESPLVAMIDLSIPAAGNLVQSASGDFLNKGVRIGDVLVIETGSGFAGTYRILEVSSATQLRIDTLFTSSGSDLRGRIVRNITVDLVEPRIPKLPFTAGPVSDLETNVGSSEFRFSTIDIQSYGAEVGDVIKVLDGADAGEFFITGFNSAPGGGVFVNREATVTAAGLRYEVYTKLTGLTFPLVRLKGLEVLDSTGQGTGITVPYGDAVDIRSTCDFEGAGEEKVTYDKQLIAFPDLSGHWDGTATPAEVTATPGATSDTRFSQNLETHDGVIRVVTAHASNPIQNIEVNVPPFLWNGKRDKLMALVTKKNANFQPGVSGDHRTSDIAEARIGDSLTITDGPNQGRYIIRDLRVMDLWGKNDVGHRKVAMIQVDPPLKVDPIRAALDFMTDNGVTEIIAGGAALVEELFGFIDSATAWDTGFYNDFLTKLQSTLAAKNVSFTLTALKEFFDPLIKSGYSVGPSAKGDLRLYFLEPVSIEFSYKDDPTTFTSATDGSKVFRIDPSLSPAQILPEADTDTPPSEWNRNLGVRYPADTFVYLESGVSLAKRGIRAGDVLEIYPAINDLPAREDMTSSWLCATQTGSNVVNLMLPPSAQVGNYTTIVAGQLLFIDSGPDIGAYTITEVISQDWGATPPVLKVRIDATLTHTTENVPGTSSTRVDFSSVSKPAFLTGILTFPISDLDTKTLTLELSTDGGTTFPTTVSHVFSGTFATMNDLVTQLNSGSLTGYTAFDAGSNKLGIRHSSGGASTVSRISGTAIGASLSFVANSVSFGANGAIALPDTKRIYGSGLSNAVVDKYISLYAAREPVVPAGTDDILASGTDVAYLGTFKITQQGLETSGEQTGEYFVQLDRTANFPSFVRAEVRWILHEGAPATTPMATSDGGTQLSDQYVRVRLYDNASKSLTITSIPWATATVSPLESNSEEQAVVESPGVIDTAAGQKNFSHKSPYRITRPGVFRMSSTSMATRRDGALYFVDVPVVGFGPGAEMNITPDEGFVLSGSYNIDGYTLEVVDENFSFSTKESVALVLPNTVLPVGSTASLENEFSLAGQDIQATYNNAPLVTELQAFFDSPLDRVSAANFLVRHFLPAYVIVDATYSSGSSEEDIAAEIIKYINNIDPATAEIRSDLVQDIIKRKGATKVELPLTLIALVHGTDRRIRGMRSATAIGLGDLPAFKGTFTQTYFIAGPNTSSQTTRPVGEQVYLKRR